MRVIPNCKIELANNALRRRSYQFLVSVSQVAVMADLPISILVACIRVAYSGRQAHLQTDV